MLTIDEIVQKYREINNTPQSVEEFRAKLLPKSPAEQISAYLSLFGSGECAVPLFLATIDAPPELFWKVLLEWWDTVDGYRAVRSILLPTLQKRKAELSPIDLLSPMDRAFYDELPQRVTVFRGCGRRYVRWPSWTTNRERAEFFARGARFGLPRDPVIGSAEIAKADLFFALASRQEAEVVLDPYRIKHLRLERVAPDGEGQAVA
jgi:hypothetical protein